MAARLGILTRFWRWLFGDPPALPSADGARAPEPIAPSPRAKCASNYCGSFVDPRCEAGNCTVHCSTWCPRHRCGKEGPTQARSVRYVSESTATLRDIADLFRAAPVPQVASIITCACGQKNRVRHSDYGKGPVCGRCKKTLGLPS